MRKTMSDVIVETTKDGMIYVYSIEHDENRGIVISPEQVDFVIEWLKLARDEIVPPASQ